MSWRTGKYGVSAGQTMVVRRWRGHVTAPALTGRRVVARTEHSYLTRMQAISAAKALRAAMVEGSGSPKDPNLWRAGKRHAKRKTRRAARRAARRANPLAGGHTTRTKIDWVAGTSNSTTRKH